MLSSFYALSGYAPDEILGQSIAILEGPQTSRETAARILRRLAANQDVAETIVHYRKDGTAFLNHFLVSMLRDETGKVIHQMCVQQMLSAKSLRGELQRSVSAARAMRIPMPLTAGMSDVRVLPSDIGPLDGMSVGGSLDFSPHDDILLSDVGGGLGFRGIGSQGSDSGVAHLDGL